MEHRVTPEWIDSLNENEIFVFGCCNSGRHFYGASNFALKYFGAVMGQREGRQGQSYAIPTIGGTIELSDIRKSVNTFTEYAVKHPELHFLVTPVGCGDGCCKVWEIAPMFRKASKLSNVSLPKDFWIELDKGRLAEVKQKLVVLWEAWLDVVSKFIGELIFTRLKMMSPHQLYKELISRGCNTTSLLEKMEWARFSDEDILDSNNANFLIDNQNRCAYIVIDNKSRLTIVNDSDINWDSISTLPSEIQKRIQKREAKYDFQISYELGGTIELMWQVSPNGKYFYLDEYGTGPQTDEKEIWLHGIIDNKCNVVKKIQVLTEETNSCVSQRHSIEITVW